MSKAEKIRNLFATTDLSYEDIADVIGCPVTYVRTVKQRMFGTGGRSVADLRYYQANRSRIITRVRARYWATKAGASS